jgi:hypothetical protein
MMMSKQLTKYIIVHQYRNDVNNLDRKVDTYESLNYCLMRAFLIRCVVSRGFE